MTSWPLLVRVPASHPRSVPPYGSEGRSRGSVSDAPPPAAMTQHQDGATLDCNITVIRPAGDGPWKGWATGSLASPAQHRHHGLTAAAVRLREGRRRPRLVAHRSRREPRPAWATTSRWRMPAVFVSPDTNESAFAHQHRLGLDSLDLTPTRLASATSQGCARRSGSTSRARSVDRTRCPVGSGGHSRTLRADKTRLTPLRCRYSDSWLTGPLKQSPLACARSF